MSWRWVGTLLASGLGFACAWQWLPVSFSGVVGLACGSLFYTAYRIIEDLLPLWFSLEERTPRKEKKHQEEKDVNGACQESGEDQRHPSGEGTASEQ